MAEKITLAEVNINVDLAIKDTQRLKEETDKLKKAADSYRGTIEENSAEHIKATAEYKASSAELRTQEALLVKLTSANKTQAGTLEKLGAANAKLRVEQKGLNLETEAGAKRNEEINNVINRNTQIIKNNSDQLVKDKMNVGNYASAFDGLGDKIQEIPGPLGNMTKGIVGMTKAAMAFIATPIGAILAAIVAAGTLVYNLFKKFDPIIDKIEQGLAAVGAVLSALKNAFLSFFSGTKSLSESFSGLGASMKQAAKDAIELKKAQQELDNLNWLLIESQAKAKRQMDELLLQSRDRTKSEKERIALIDEALKIEEGAYLKKKQIADEEYKQVLGKIALNNALTEEQKKNLDEQGVAYAIHLKDTKALTDDEVKSFAEAIAAREAVLNESVNLREKAMIRQNVLLEKAEAEREKADEKAKVAREKEIEEKEKAAEKEIEAKKKVLEQTLANLQIELDTYLLTNQSKLKSSEELTQALIAEEVTRQTEINAKEKEALDLQLANKLMSQEEYAYALLEQKTNLQLLESELQLEFEEQEKERKIEQAAIDFENDMILQEGNLFGELELERKYLELQRKQEVDAATKAGADVSKVNAKYRKAARTLDRAEFDAKLSMAAGFASNIASIAGEQTAIGKAAAVASTTIATIQSAVNSYNSLSGISVVGPVLGAVAAAAALYSGYAQVKQILSVKSGLPGEGKVSASVPSAGNNVPNVPSVTASTVAPTVGAGIVSRGATDSATESVTNGVSTALQQTQLQPTLVIDDVTNKQQSDLSQQKTSAL
jgi:hypothetical protein